MKLNSINDLFAIIGVIANILFSCLNFRFTQKNKKNKLSIEQMKKDIETDLKNDHKERRKIEEYTSLMEKCKATDAIFSFLRKSDEIITRENIDLENEISKLESIFSDINSLKYLIVEENSDSFLEFEKYLTDLIDNRNNELMRQNIARFLFLKIWINGSLSNDVGKEKS
ncbi:hypothetical protein [Enterococcus faecium]|uniref:hypothetical protein n=1 Tax=Enterococcus faecium TaxID=1352 RepID=UPI0038BCE2FC